MLSKLIALSLIAVNPTPLPSKVADERWAELGSIHGIEAPDINEAIVDQWPGLTINDFKWIEDEWFQHDDKAYELNLEYSFTTFWERYY